MIHLPIREKIDRGLGLCVIERGGFIQWDIQGHKFGRE